MSQKVKPPIMFRLPDDVLKRLEAYAKTQSDEFGKPLTVSKAARRLMLESLDKKRGK